MRQSYQTWFESSSLIPESKSKESIVNYWAQLYEGLVPKRATSLGVATLTVYIEGEREVDGY